MLLRTAANGTEVLFMQRASSPLDPWSGQISLPGGRREAEDVNVAATAVREVFEETAADLTTMKPLGRLDDQPGRHSGKPAGLTVSCHVYQSEREVVLKPNYEVAELFWAPLATLIDPASRFSHQTSYREQPFTAINLGSDRILWGLTLRFVNNMLAITSDNNNRLHNTED